jgi:two-component system, NarL family, invasion response regulator UvrY
MHDVSRSRALRIMLVDDHAIVRAGFRRLLEQQEEWRVVAEAADAESAYALFVEHDPDIVVLDVSMRGLSGLDAIRRILARRPSARILVFSMHEDPALAERAVQLGARGYVTKGSSPDALASAVADIVAGGLAFSPDIAQSLALLRVTGGGSDPLRTLTPREFEIFRLLAAGHSIRTIAALVSLSSKTVSNYYSLIKQKLGISTDVELVLLAQRQHLAEGASGP